ncbi:MAG: hypothetical protein EBR30_00105 [Cytophagia bacterium]|jgi:hypothetical protein|nr:hypothetical protein [Cytophagia bacterium]
MASASQFSAFSTLDETNAQLVTLSQKYLGNKEYVLSGTNTGYIGAEVTPLAPWTNLTNRYYPTVATLPEIGSNIVTKGDLGGYFTPNNLGVSLYQTKDITNFIDTTKITSGSIYEYIDPTLYNKGRGLTQKDQDNIIVHIENTDWMKGSLTDTAFDGQVKNSDIYQKFIPYQSNIESQKADTNGVITIKDNFEYWTGSQKNIWLQDNKFTELDWLKYFDLDLRTKYNLITPDKELYSWHADVYGNQYALYKPTLSARTIYEMQNSYGTVWVKTADNTVYEAVDALSAIYSRYSAQPTIYNQLTSNNIKNIEVFFDTLVIELSGYVLFEKITFDYDTATIDTGDVQYLYLDLSTNVSTRLLSSLSLTGVSLNSTAKPYYGGIWFDEPSKKFTTCLLLSTGFSSGLSGIIVPVLYEYDINAPANRKRIYPTNTTDYSDFIYYSNNSQCISAGLIGAQGAPSKFHSGPKELLTYIENPVITYNKSTNAYFITFIGYVDQQFKLINYSTSTRLVNRVLVTETDELILTETDCAIAVV